MATGSSGSKSGKSGSGGAAKSSGSKSKSAARKSTRSTSRAKSGSGSSTKAGAQVTLRGRFRPGSRVRLVEATGTGQLRPVEGAALANSVVGEDGSVTFKASDGVSAGGRYFISGYVDGHPLDVRVRGRAADDPAEGLEQAPIGPVAVRHGDGTLVGYRGQPKAGTPKDKPAVPFHPKPGEEG